ncbi:MAG TPA: ABC transporter permease [Vicinamibacterales bacterium]|jgi:putative ABC transport system permease protein
MFESLLQDARQAARFLRRSPGFTFAAVVTLGLAIGANSAIFAVVRAVLLRPLPYADADRLVMLGERWPNLSGTRPVSMLNYLDWTHESTVFEKIAAVSWGSVTVNDGPRPTFVEGALVSPSYFEVFGLRSALGRTFAPGEDQPGRTRVVVLSHRLWVSQFASDRGIVGKAIRLDGEVYTVIGVMPIRTTVHFLDPLLWRPLAFDGVPPRGSRGLRWAVGKLKPGVTLPQARAEMDAIGERLARAYPDSNRGFGVVVDPYPRPVGINVEPSLYLLFAAVGAVLLVACVNLASLALARARTRAREVAIRVAVGASRSRIIRECLIEHLMIAGAGVACAGLIGYGFLKALGHTIPTTGLRAAFPADTLIEMDAIVWMFTLGLAACSGIAFGLAPAFRSTRVPVASAMTGEDRPGVSAGRATQRSRAVLVGVEVALAFVLLTTAVLLTNSLLVLTSRIGSGFDSRNVVTAGLPTPLSRFDSGAAHNAYLDGLARRLQSLPGVSDVAFTDSPPTYGAPYLTRPQVVGRPVVPFMSRPIAGFKVVSPSYFRAVGLHLLSGRALEEGDRGRAPLAIVVNETFARTHFAGQDPLGQRLLMRRIPFEGGLSAAGPGRQVAPTADEAWTIVGVIADEGVSPFDDRVPQPTVYATREQHPRRNLAMVVRTSFDVAGIQTSIRRAVEAFDGDQALDNLRPLDDFVTEDVAPDRLRTILLGSFAAIAVVLAALGLYGVMAHAVIQRTREIGIRAALGATRGKVVLLVSRQAMVVVAAGIAAGAAGALIVARLLTIFLYGVEPSDPGGMIMAAGALTLIALLACCIPALRATRIDPMVALREG